MGILQDVQLRDYIKQFEHCIFDGGTSNLVTVIWMILKLRVIGLGKGRYQEENAWCGGEDWNLHI